MDDTTAGMSSSPAKDAGTAGEAEHQPELDGDGDGASGTETPARKRRRGSRGGQRRRKSSAARTAAAPGGDGEAPGMAPAPPADQPELPENPREGRLTADVAERTLVRKPQIGDTRPAPAVAATAAAPKPAAKVATAKTSRRKQTTRGRGRGADKVAVIEIVPTERRGRERNGRPVGRYTMCVQVRDGLSQVAVLEGRNLIEHYVSRPADDVSQIHGNIYVGRVQNVLPGMEAAFVDIATPKNAVLYRGDVQYDAEDIEQSDPRIEQILRARQLIVCQVTKNPIGAKGARLTQEVSLPGRYVVLIPNSKTYGISKRLPDDVRKRLRSILDRVKPSEHGLIVRTAAEHATEDELRADMRLLLGQWEEIAAKAAKAKAPTLLYREPELAVRVIREEFNADYRHVVIDDRRLHEEIKFYVSAFNPELADRIEYYDTDAEGLSLYEQFHVHEQVHKALDRKVWLPSGGSLIIEHTEALTVIDVNTGKNVGTSSLEETVFHNNLEAAEEIAKQLRLRDIGGIIVIDFIDMEIRENRDKVVEVFRNALARDKTRSQVFSISELGLVEMTRKRIGEGLLTEFSTVCEVCEGRGVIVDHALLD
jgi:ribonuclease E